MGDEGVLNEELLEGILAGKWRSVLVLVLEAFSVVAGSHLQCLR
jgi:hypothetical protein